tara:strand:+ start:1055 stop:1825 length:771 start_codon:yes stop_codon:yes gene_type:complete
MKKLLLTLLLVITVYAVSYSQNYKQQNFLLPLEISGTQLIQEGVDFEIPQNTILHMLTNDGALQYRTNNYASLECPCIIGPGNIVAHSFDNDGENGVLYYYDESSYIKPITINGEDTWNTWVVPDNKFWYVLHSNFYNESFTKGDILWAGREISTNESNNYFLAVEYDIIAYNSSLSLTINSLQPNPILFPNPTTSKIALNSSKDYKIEIFDMAGNKVMETSGNNIDMSVLSSAMYIVKAFDKATKETKSYKVVKN